MTAMPIESAVTVEYVGPFETHNVVYGGREVPLLTAHPLPGGRVDLVLDRMHILTLSVQDAERVVPFIADAIAIGLGYSGHPLPGNEPRQRHLMPRLIGITDVVTGEI